MTFVSDDADATSESDIACQTIGESGVIDNPLWMDLDLFAFMRIAIRPVPVLHSWHCYGDAEFAKNIPASVRMGKRACGGSVYRHLPVADAVKVSDAVAQLILILPSRKSNYCHSFTTINYQ